MIWSWRRFCDDGGGLSKLIIDRTWILLPGMIGTIWGVCITLHVRNKSTTWGWMHTWNLSFLIFPFFLSFLFYMVMCFSITEWGCLGARLLALLWAWPKLVPSFFCFICTREKSRTLPVSDDPLLALDAFDVSEGTVESPLDSSLARELLDWKPSEDQVFAKNLLALFVLPSICFPNPMEL